MCANQADPRQAQPLPSPLSDELLRELFEFAPDAMLIVDRAGQIINCNEQAETMFGYRRSELLGQSIEALIPERLRDQYAHHRENYLAAPSRRSTGKDLTPIARRQDGTEFRVDVSLGPLTVHGDVVVVAIVHDVTDRIQAEEQTGKQLRRLAALRSIDVSIAGSLDLRVTLDILLDRVASELAVDAASVLLHEASTLTLTYAAARGFRAFALRNTHLRFGEGLAGHVALERKITAIPSLETWLTENPQTTVRLPAAEDFVAYVGAPLLAKGNVVGVLEIWHRAPLTPSADWFDFIEALAGQAAIAIDDARLFNELQRAKLEVELAYDNTIEAWGRALEFRDIETKGHTRRVTELAVRLARAMGIAEAELLHVRRGALLHDIGKMGIPDSILLKPDKLTEEELGVMRKHPQYAYDVLKGTAYLRPALEIPYCHHEKWDGSGYPRGLKGEQIPLVARIFAVVDTWDALRSDRPYKKAWPEPRAREYILANSGKHYDPQVVGVFAQLF